MEEGTARRTAGALEFIVASANFGGAARALTALGARSHFRVAGLVNFISNPSCDSSSGTLPTVIGIQEMTRLLDPPVDHPGKTHEELSALGLKPRVFFAATLSTDRYPLAAKWRVRWEHESIRRMEQGTATVSTCGAELGVPEQRPAPAHVHRGLVIDLPMVEFAQPGRNEGGPASLGGWITHRWAEMDSRPVTFRHTHYRGDRDTEPRIATAHRVELASRAGEPRRAFVFVNLHLATLKEENREDKLLPGDGVPRTARVPTDQACFLRLLQLSVVGDFIRGIYRSLRLPVIVVGDFNATPESVELRWFGRDAALKVVFSSHRCWRCANEIGGASQPGQYYTHDSCKEILAANRDEFSICAEEGAKLTPATISAEEYCDRCGVMTPLFTHKRNFSLIDNILCTDPSRLAGLEAGGGDITLDAELQPSGQAGIRLDTCFSDHLPIWSRFTIA